MSEHPRDESAPTPDTPPPTAPPPTAPPAAPPAVSVPAPASRPSPGPRHAAPEDPEDGPSPDTDATAVLPAVPAAPASAAPIAPVAPAARVPDAPVDDLRPVDARHTPNGPAGPDETLDTARPRRHTRRWFLAGAGAVVVAGGAGVGAAFLRPDDGDARRPAPSELVDAVTAERRLLADLAATTGGDDAVRQVVAQATADHRAHLTTLEALLGAYARPAAASPSPGAPRTRAQLRAAEQTASSDAAARAAAATDAKLAVVLASISACEAGHAALLAEPPA